MNMNRRQFLTTTIAGAGSMVLSKSLAAAQSVNPYEIVPLGKTGIKVSRIGMGTGMRGGNRQSNHTRMGQEKFTALIRAGYERGVRVFDAADMYGTHPYLAKALAGVPRENYVLVSKIWTHPSGGLPEKERPAANIVVDRFRKELNTDYIDIVQVHCMWSPNWIDEEKKQMDIMEDLKAKGIIKAHGASIHHLESLKACATSKWVDVVHARINHNGTAMDGKPEVVVPVLKQIHDAGKGIIGMKLIGEGKFTKPEDRDAAIRFVLELGTVDTMIVGFETVQQIDDFATRLANAMQAIKSA